MLPLSCPETRPTTGGTSTPGGGLTSKFETLSFLGRQDPFDDLESGDLRLRRSRDLFQIQKEYGINTTGNHNYCEAGNQIL